LHYREKRLLVAVLRQGGIKAVAAAFEPGHLPLSVWLLQAAVYPGFVSADRWRTAAELQPLYVREKVAMTTEERHLQKDLVWQKYSERDLSSMMVIEHEAYPVPWTSGNFRDADRAGSEISLLKERGIMIGYVVWMKVLDEAHLLNFTLSPARQGQGLGTWMLSSLLSQIRVAGLRKILLEVRPSNQRAIMLYGKFGFQTIGRRKGYYPHAVVAGVLGSTRAEAVREDAIIMQKEV
jgi:ribosomal-protein-alanine N-acetyltransferase